MAELEREAAEPEDTSDEGEPDSEDDRAPPYSPCSVLDVLAWFGYRQPIGSTIAEAAHDMEMDPAEVCAAMTAACEAVLGYDQPVEEKPLGEDVSDSAESDSAGSGDG